LPAHKNSRTYVLDANALISFIEHRPIAGERVRDLFARALRSDEKLLMSAVNWGEVLYIIWKHRGESGARSAETTLPQLPFEVVSADQARASRAAALKHKHALGYADAFAAELALERNGWLVTADPEFAKVGKALSVYSLPRHDG
jgi:predicted nucleic acid-binding protein